MGHHHGEDEGATAVEYGILAGALGVVFIAAGPRLVSAMSTLVGVVVDAILG